MSEIRPVRPDELDAVAALFNNAYRIGLQTAHGWTDGLPPEETIAAIDQGRVASFVRMVRYNVWVGGGEMQMGGVGGVSTWADVQGKGFAGQLVRKSIQIMRDRGDAVSALYPFSHRYYGKFGWESIADKILYTDVQQSNFIPYEERSMVRWVEGEKAIDALDAVYREFALRHNGMVIRTRLNWERRIKSLEGDRGQVYLVEKDGKAIGYFFCENQPTQPWGYECTARDFAFTTPEACKAMFGFFSTLPTNVVKITIAAPAFPPLVSHFKEPFFTMKWSQPIQYRVLDVQKAVALRGYAAGAEGRAVIAIRDDHADWNTGVWEIEVGGGKGCARQSTAQPDIQMTIQQFSKLFMGAMDCAALLRQGLFAGSLDLARRLDGIFRDQPVFIMDAF